MANFKRRTTPSINCSCSPFIHQCDYPILPLVILIWIKYIKSLFVSWRININNLAKVHLEKTLAGQLRQNGGPAGEPREDPEDLFKASLKPLHSMAGHWGLAEEGVVCQEDLLPENTTESTSLSSHTLSRFFLHCCTLTLYLGRVWKRDREPQGNPSLGLAGSRRPYFPSQETLQPPPPHRFLCHHPPPPPPPLQRVPLWDRSRTSGNCVSCLVFVPCWGDVDGESEV